MRGKEIARLGCGISGSVQHFPVRVPAGRRSRGKRRWQVARNRLYSRSPGSPQSTSEAIAIGGFDDAAGGSQRGEPLVEGGSTHAAVRTQLGEEERSMSAGKGGSNALVERMWHWRCGLATIDDL